MSRALKTQEEISQERKKALGLLQAALPTEKLIVVYGRQSTAKQVVNDKESAQYQAIDLLDHALALGWPDHKRRLFIENQLADGIIKNASGRLGIEKRPGLQLVYALIDTGEVGAVLVCAIDRLFRDETLVGPVVFADLCKKKGIILLIYDGESPTKKLDFANADDHKYFIDEAHAAAEYNRKHVKGKMLGGRNKKAKRGEYPGGGVPTGLMLDDDRKFLVPNPEWAPIMAHLLHRFRELDGNFAEFRREIVGKCIFPDLPEDILERIGRIHLTKVEGGYTVKSIDGLKSMLTSVTLIGHIAFDGHLVRNVHPAIVPLDDWQFARDHLADTDLDGVALPRPEKIIRYNNASYPALLQGKRSSGGTTLTSAGQAVFVMPQGQKNEYAYCVRDQCKIAVNQDVTRINVDVLDALFVDRFLERLESFRDMHKGLVQITTHDPLVWQIFKDYIQGRITEQEVDQESPYHQLLAIQHEKPVFLVSLPETIAENKKAIARLKRDYEVNFDLMTDKELRENRQARLQLAKDIATMEKKLEDEAATKEDMRDVHTLVQDARTIWPTLSLERQRRYIRLTTQSIELDVLADGWLILFVRWSPYMGYDTTDVALIWRQRGSGKVWTETEKSILERSYSTASRGWILDQLPTRSWESIRAQAFKQGLHRAIQPNDTDLPLWVSREDKRIMDTYKLEYEDASQRVWWRLFVDFFKESTHEAATTRSRW